MEKTKLLVILLFSFFLTGCIQAPEEGSQAAAVEPAGSTCTNPPQDQLATMDLSDLENVCRPVYCYGSAQKKGGTEEYSVYVYKGRVFIEMITYPMNVAQDMNGLNDGEQVGIPPEETIEVDYYYTQDLSYTRNSEVVLVPGHPYAVCSWAMLNTSRVAECASLAGKSVQVVLMTKEKHFEELRRQSPLLCSYSDFGEDIFEIQGEVCDGTEELCNAILK